MSGCCLSAAITWAPITSVWPCDPVGRRKSSSRSANWTIGSEPASLHFRNWLAVGAEATPVYVGGPHAGLEVGGGPVDVPLEQVLVGDELGGVAVQVEVGVRVGAQLVVDVLVHRVDVAEVLVGVDLPAARGSRWPAPAAARRCGASRTWSTSSTGRTASAPGLGEHLVRDERRRCM